MHYESEYRAAYASHFLEDEDTQGYLYKPLVATGQVPFQVLFDARLYQSHLPLDNSAATSNNIPSMDAQEELNHWPGDLAHRDQDISVWVVNETIGKHMRLIGEALTSDEQAEVERLQAEIDTLRASLNEQHHSPEAQAIRKRLSDADTRVLSGSVLDRVVQRVQAFNGIHWSSDADNTITDASKNSHLLHSIHRDPKNPQIAPNYLEELFPGSGVAEPMLKTAEGRAAFPKAFVKVWQPLLREMPGAFKKAGELVPLRPGVDEFFSAVAKAPNEQAVMVTANFEPAGKGIISRIVAAKDVPIVGVTETSIVSTAKDAILKQLSLRNPDQILFYIGDGASDIPALDARDYIGCYFALENSEFAKALEAAGLPYFTYKDFHDIAALRNQIKQAMRVPVAVA